MSHSTPWPGVLVVRSVPHDDVSLQRAVTALALSVSPNSHCVLNFAGTEHVLSVGPDGGLRDSY